MTRRRIFPIPTEMAAADAMLDDVHVYVPNPPDDHRRSLAMLQPDDDIFIQQILSWAKTNRNFSSAYPDVEKPREYFKKVYYKRLLNIFTALFRPEDPPHLAEEIVQNCTAVFCILLHIGKGKYIDRFVEHSSLGDLKLPLDPDAPPARFPQSTTDSKFFEHHGLLNGSLVLQMWVFQLQVSICLVTNQSV
jgi:hypothetical protein